MSSHAYPPKADCILFVIPRPSSAEDINDRPAAFELEIPIADLRQLVLRPVRWLRLVAWGLLNSTGRILDERHAEPLPDDLPFDQLQGGASYTFLPDNGASFNLINLEHFRAQRGMHPARSGGSDDSESTCSVGSTYTDDSATARQDKILAARDGSICIFSGDDCVKKTHVLPYRFAGDQTSLHAIARERNFAIDHHLDAANRLTIDVRMQDFWTQNRCFILATDPAFVRDEDVPQPQGPPLGSADWRARDEPADETYVWQSVQRLLGPRTGLRRSVRFNERARFASGVPDSRPCARAINYIYAAGMLELYRRPCPDGDRALSRPLPVVAPNPARAHKKHRDHTGTPVLAAFYDMTLAAALAQAEALRQEDEDARMRRVRDWTVDADTVMSEWP